MKRSTKAVIAVFGILVVLGVSIGATFVLGAVQQPTADVEDIGDWGEVTEDRTEIITSFWVYNPNQLGISISGNARASYELHLNGVNVAQGTKRGMSVPPGNSTVTAATEVRNEKLPAWWVAFIRNNETIFAKAQPSVTVNVGPLTASPELSPWNKTVFADATPVSSALSQIANETEGQYTTTVRKDDLKILVNQGYLERSIAEEVSESRPAEQARDEIQNDQLNQIIAKTSNEEVTVGYEVRRGWAEWGNVTKTYTTVYFHFEIYNPSETICMPAEPEHLGVTVKMNDVPMLRGQGDETSLHDLRRRTDQDTDAACARNASRTIIPPQESREVVYAVQMDNNKIDEWFASHARRGEKTTVTVEFQLVFSAGNTTFWIPEDDPYSLTCELQTGILVDGQANRTTCTPPDLVPGVGTSESPSDSGSDRDSDGNETNDDPPTARIEANQTEGQAPLTVSFDASKSTDPNDDIVEYNWWLEGDIPAGQGETVTHTFGRRGTFTVELTVVDSEDNKDSATANVTVEPRVTTPEPKPPTAHVTADPTEGEAPLTVEFSAAESTDPNDDIVEYIWRFKDGSPPARGETVEHTFQTAGEYKVELVVVDSEGNRDTVTVTISVERRV